MSPGWCWRGCQQTTTDLGTVLETSTEKYLSLDVILPKLPQIEQRQQTASVRPDGKALLANRHGGNPGFGDCGKKGHVKAECRRKRDEARQGGAGQLSQQRSYAAVALSGRAASDGGAHSNRLSNRLKPCTTANHLRFVSNVYM